MQLLSKTILVNIAAVNATRHTLLFIDFVGLGASFSLLEKTKFALVSGKDQYCMCNL